MTKLGLESINKTKLQEEWTTGAQPYLGTSVSGCPNTFHTYGPHGLGAAGEQQFELYRNIPESVYPN